MKFEWINNSANVGRLELRVRQSLYSGKWNAMVYLLLNPLGSHHEFESDAAAREWCEEWVRNLFAPALDAARAEEREACAALVDQLAIKANSSWHRHQEVLRDAAAAIRARSMETKP